MTALQAVKESVDLAASQPGCLKCEWRIRVNGQIVATTVAIRLLRLLFRHVADFDESGELLVNGGFVLQAAVHP